MGILAMFMIVMGGVQWLFAAGNSSKIGSAKETIVAAILGLLLAFVSFGLLRIINPDLVNCTPFLSESSNTDNNSEVAKNSQGQENPLQNISVSGTVTFNKDIGRIVISPYAVCSQIVGGSEEISLVQMKVLDGNGTIENPKPKDVKDNTVQFSLTTLFERQKCLSPKGMIFTTSNQANRQDEDSRNDYLNRTFLFGGVPYVGAGKVCGILEDLGTSASQHSSPDVSSWQPGTRPPGPCVDQWLDPALKYECQIDTTDTLLRGKTCAS